MFIATLAVIGGMIAAALAVARAPRLPRAWPMLVIAAIPAVMLLFGVHHTMLCVAAIIGLVVWTHRNWWLAGVPIIATGALLNLAVMALHNGAMPITDATLHALGYTAPVGTLLFGSKDVVVEPSVLTVFGDWIIVSLGTSRVMVASPGDVVLAVGLLWWLWFSGTSKRGFHDVRSASVSPRG